MPGRIADLFSLLALTVTLSLAACAAGATTQSRDAGTCNDNSDCDPGYLCVGNTCVVDGDAATGTPSISVTPHTLTFADAAEGNPQTESVTITNAGTGTLIITGVTLNENDGNAEFSHTDPAQTSLGAGESTTVEVTLDPTDGDADSGQLLIDSNDTAVPTVTVELMSSFIGTPDLAVCVEPSSPPPPLCADPAVVDFGEVSYAGTELREFYVRNEGDGNKVITVEDLIVHATPAHSALYTLELFRMQETPQGSGNWQEFPATLPFTLVASTLSDPDPDALYGRINFTANTDGFLILSGDAMEITTTDTDNPNPAYTSIPITGTIDGCPPGLQDLNGDPTDGCEYGCTVTNGGVEICDGQDNDCDGTTDNFTESCYDDPDQGCNPDGTGCQGICQAGTRTCTGGTWSACQGQVTGVPEQCDDLDNDCDGTVNNGLDVPAGNTCANAIPASSVGDGSCNHTDMTGSITTGDNDWYDIVFTSATNSTTFHARLEFVGGTSSNFRMEVRLANCSTAVGCETGSNSNLTVMDWDIDPGPNGRCPGNTSCTHTIDARVRVYRVGGPACETYTLRASNGC